MVTNFGAGMGANITHEDVLVHAQKAAGNLAVIFLANLFRQVNICLLGQMFSLKLKLFVTVVAKQQ